MGSRPLVFAVVVALAVPAGARADVPSPDGHGPDGRGVDRGPEISLRAVGAAAPPAWCGEERPTDDTVNEVDNGAYRFHAIYALPADGPSRLRELAPTLQADAFQASALLERTYGRAIRFDMGTSCGPAYLDISTVRLPQTTAELAELARTGDGTLNAVARALTEQGFPTLAGARRLDELTRNYVVWLDGPGPPEACGQAFSYEDASRTQTNLNNYGGKVALVFGDERGFCGSNTVRHEIGHTLGALQPQAPNAYDGAHCDDALEDTMCSGSAPRVGGGGRGQYFDYGNDDYWDPAGGELGWWTVNLSRFLCPDTACNGGGPPAAPPAPASAPTPVAAPSAAPARPAPRLRVKLRRSSRGDWKVTVRATGSGRALVALRCRPRKGAAKREVLRRTVGLPTRVRARVRCLSRPAARIKRLA